MLSKPYDEKSVFRIFKNFSEFGIRVGSHGELYTKDRPQSWDELWHPILTQSGYMRDELVSLKCVQVKRTRQYLGGD